MDKIILDRKTFEALAMETRVKIMKSLKERRKTQSELAKELSLAPSTVSEHLDKMLDSDLILRKKDHHKWIYYELTEKGRNILSPQKPSVFVFALSLTLVAAAFAYLFLTSINGSLQASGAKESAPLAAGNIVENSAAAAQPDYLMLAAGIIIIIAILLLVFYWIRKKRAISH